MRRLVPPLCGRETRHFGFWSRNREACATRCRTCVVVPNGHAVHCRSITPEESVT
jgi:hypothetical protein